MNNRLATTDVKIAHNRKADAPADRGVVTIFMADDTAGEVVDIVSGLDRTVRQISTLIDGLPTTPGE
jgi:hypothetical protein